MSRAEKVCVDFEKTGKKLSNFHYANYLYLKVFDASDSRHMLRRIYETII